MMGFRELRRELTIVDLWCGGLRGGRGDDEVFVDLAKEKLNGMRCGDRVGRLTDLNRITEK
jgi:hypothetical protein